MSIAQAYLYLNSALFLSLAVWGTAIPQGTATRLGYLTLSDRGRAEYLTTYGGLQIGLAIMFILLARSGDPALGLRIAIGIYAPIVFYRIMTNFTTGAAIGSTLGAISLEALLLLAAIWLLYSKTA